MLIQRLNSSRCLHPSLMNITHNFIFNIWHLFSNFIIECIYLLVWLKSTSSLNFWCLLDLCFLDLLVWWRSVLLDHTSSHLLLFLCLFLAIWNLNIHNLRFLPFIWVISFKTTVLVLINIGQILLIISHIPLTVIVTILALSLICLRCNIDLVLGFNKTLVLNILWWHLLIALSSLLLVVILLEWWNLLLIIVFLVTQVLNLRVVICLWVTPDVAWFVNTIWSTLVIKIL